MNKYSFLIVWLTCLLMVAPAMAAKTSYSGTCGNSITWSLNTTDGTLRLVGSGEMTRYAKETNVPWDTLRSYIKHVEMDERITYIATYSFCRCGNLEELIFADHLTETPALWFCPKLRSVHMSKNFKEIPNQCFYGSTGLDSLYLYDSITSFGREAFYGMRLRYISWGPSVKSLGNNLCASAVIQKLDYRGSIADWCKTSVESGTIFTASTLLYVDGAVADSIYIPDEITEINRYCFSNYTKMRYCSYKEGTKIDLEAFQGVTCPLIARREGMEDVVDYHQGMSNDVHWLYKRSDQSLTFESGAMADYSLPNNPAPWVAYPIDSIYFHWDLRRLGNCAFANMTSLRTYNRIGDYITSIGDSVFYGCPSLNRLVTIPLAVDSIGKDVFEGCFLKEIDYYKYLKFNEKSFPDNGTLIVRLDTLRRHHQYFGEDVYFELVIEDSTLTIYGKGDMVDGYYYIPWAKVPNKIKYLYIKDSVTSVHADLCLNCTKLQNVYFESPITQIGVSAFQGCSSLNPVVLPKTLSEIGNSAFYGCTRIDTISLPAGLTTLGTHAFCNAQNLRRIYFNDCPIPYIPNNAFNGCAMLDSIVLPSKVASIGVNSFNSAKNLKYIDWNNCPITTIYNSAFYGCTSLDTISLPEGITTVEKNAFTSCTNLVAVELPKSIYTIGSEAFKGSSRIRSFRYAGTVEDWIKVKLGNATANPSSYSHRIFFEDNRMPREIHFSDTVTSIGAYAFYNDTLLKEVSYYSTTTIGKDAFTGTGANIIVKNKEAQTTNAMIHGKMTTHKAEKLIRAVFRLTQKSSNKTIVVTTDKSGTFLLDWDTGTFTPVGASIAQRMPMDDLGSVVIITIVPTIGSTSLQTSYSLDVEVRDLPSTGKYPYILRATTEYTEKVVEESQTAQGETIVEVHQEGEQNDYLLCTGIIDTGDDGGIEYWGGDKFFVPDDQTDVYDLYGHYVGKWNKGLPHGTYIIAKGDKVCKITW